MSTNTSVRERNEELANKINQEALRNPQAPYMGKFLGLVDGEVVVVADTLDELGRRLDELAVEPERTFCIEIGIDYDKPQWI